jgi:hypothetical protein
MNARPVAALTVIAMFAACAADRPAGTSGFDESTGVVEVFVAGDGFAQCSGERQPVDEVIVRLRQRTRAMTKDQLAGFVVHLRLAPGIADGEPAKVANEGLNRLLRELEVMGVTQARWL